MVKTVFKTIDLRNQKQILILVPTAYIDMSVKIPTAYKSLDKRHIRHVMLKYPRLKSLYYTHGLQVFIQRLHIKNRSLFYSQRLTYKSLDKDVQGMSVKKTHGLQVSRLRHIRHASILWMGITNQEYKKPTV